LFWAPITKRTLESIFFQGFFILRRTIDRVPEIYFKQIIRHK